MFIPQFSISYISIKCHFRHFKKYMFPAPKTKTIGSILEILVGDWKYTGTLNTNTFTLFDQQFTMSNSMYILVTHLCRYKNNFILGFLHLAEVWNRYGKQVWVKYQVSGPTKTTFENTRISDRTIHGHKCIDNSSTEQPNIPG